MERYEEPPRRSPGPPLSPPPRSSNAPRSAATINSDRPPAPPPTRALSKHNSAEEPYDAPPAKLLRTAPSSSAQSASSGRVAPIDRTQFGSISPLGYPPLGSFKVRATLILVNVGHGTTGGAEGKVIKSEAPTTTKCAVQYSEESSEGSSSLDDGPGEVGRLTRAADIALLCLRNIALLASSEFAEHRTDFTKMLTHLLLPLAVAQSRGEDLVSPPPSLEGGSCDASFEEIPSTGSSSDHAQG